ncbi:MAG TPA: superoxide dismutase [Cu-Zn] SodC [Methylobacter sp.]
MKISPAIILFVSSVGCASAAEIAVPMNTVNATGTVKSIGNITITESPYGLIFSPSIEGLEAGIHGFHVHESPSCEPKDKDGKPVAALAAGSHYDPNASKHHGAPWSDGHLGDLPALVVGPDGKANYAVLAPRLKISDVKSHALIIHEGGDNYSDDPALLGGGGARIACGVIKG